MPNSTSTSLLLRVKQGDCNSWQRLVDVYGGLVYFWCRGWGVDRENTKDIVQDVFRRVYTGIHRFQKKSRRGGFRAWLRTIARNVTIDYFHRRNRQPVGQGGTDHQLQMLSICGEIPEADAHEEAEQVAVLRMALQSIRSDFQDRTWQIFWKSTMEGVDTKVLASDFDMTRRAIRQAKHRVMSRLREEFDGLVDFQAFGCDSAPPTDSESTIKR